MAAGLRPVRHMLPVVATPCPAALLHRGDGQQVCPNCCVMCSRPSNNYVEFTRAATSLFISRSFCFSGLLFLVQSKHDISRAREDKQTHLSDQGTLGKTSDAAHTSCFLSKFCVDMNCMLLRYKAVCSRIAEVFIDELIIATDCP